MKCEPDEKQWLVWQMIDSMYPTGGFAHSMGLEAAVQEKLVLANHKTPDNGSLRQFLVSSLHQTANFALPMVFSMVNPASNDITSASFMQVNATTHALLTNHVARKASIAQGSALLRVAMSTYEEFHILLAIRQTLAQERKQTCATTGPHFAVVFGLVCRLLGVDASTSQRMFLYVTLRDLLSAATRLNLIGPLEAARLQYDLRHEVSRTFEKKRDRDINQAYSSAPLVDLVQAMHDQLYTRIFNS